MAAVHSALRPAVSDQASVFRSRGAIVVCVRPRRFVDAVHRADDMIRNHAAEPVCKEAAVVTVDDIMIRELVEVSMDTTLSAVRDQFNATRFHHALVVENGRAVGVISDRDLLKALSPFIGKMAERPSDVATLSRKAHQVMTRKIISVAPGTSAAAAARIMNSADISCIPVLDNTGRCQGIVTWRRLIAWAADEVDRIDRAA